MKITLLLIIAVFGFYACSSLQSETSYAEIEKSVIEESTDSLIIQKIEITIDTISICLPYPNDEFFSLKATNFSTNDTINILYYDDIYWYLITNLDSIDSKKILGINKDTETLWGQHFTNDVYIIQDSRLETGSETHLYTHCKDKQAFFNTINSIILWQELDSTYHNPNMSWNKDSTFYEPIDGGAGCYYEIKKDSVENYMLEWYCGC